MSSLQVRVQPCTTSWQTCLLATRACMQHVHRVTPPRLGPFAVVLEKVSPHPTPPHPTFAVVLEKMVSEDPTDDESGGEVPSGDADEPTLSTPSKVVANVAEGEIKQLRDQVRVLGCARPPEPRGTARGLSPHPTPVPPDGWLASAAHRVSRSDG